MNFIAICLIYGIFAFAETAFPKMEKPEKVLWQDEVKAIDLEIQDLEHIKHQYQRSAYRHLEQADRWQFNSDLYLEMRKEYDLAEKDLQMMQQVQEQIHILEMKKQRILKEHQQIDAQN